jgi:hypothetical protein
VRTVKFQIYEWQRAIASGVDETHHCQWRVSSKPREVRWKGAARFVYIRSKRATASDAFRKNNETRHCQWHISNALLTVARYHSYI